MAVSPNLIMALPLILILSLVASQDTSFSYHGFRSANLSLDGMANITSDGLLELTNTSTFQTGHAFYPSPISLKNSSNGNAFSFSSTFVFAIIPNPDYSIPIGHGLALVIAPTRGLPGGASAQYLGLFNFTNNGNSSNHVVAIELDTFHNQEFGDINNNHVGIDINGLRSNISAPVEYYVDDNSRVRSSLDLVSGQQMQVWVEYDGVKKEITVTLAPINATKPENPLLYLYCDLSPILHQNMYIGFSASTGRLVSNHYIVGWSFRINGQAPELVRSRLPVSPLLGTVPQSGGKKRLKFFTIGLPVIIVSLAVGAISSLVYVVRRKRQFAELQEDWELDYGAHRFTYKDLYMATGGFREKELLGSGGFGRVYRGILPTSKIEIAVKRVSHESRQGMREFVAEIVSIGRLRHRNLVPLLGYCRRKEELLLVYEYMPNGSLDKYLFGQPKVTLGWGQRFRAVKGVATGLFYLHEQWEQVVVHRDVKASNVLLDGELNGRLGDFGLARLYDHGTDPQTTHLAGTIGYLAPENFRGGKATTNTDVFAFGAFLLEVACGRRPIEQNRPTEDVLLVNWVFSHWKRGDILGARDPNLGEEYVAEEVELVLKLGLLCSHSAPAARPSMRQILQYLEADVPPPPEFCASSLAFAHCEAFDDFYLAYQASVDNAAVRSSFVAESVLSGGR
ncbi:hypothetical protein F2P56_008416 [Juglans regia]|uniref:non-specific serine/threonine protein kinase n=2 Tax=Juglans regia TaxID=51240 RepID=A0A2I4F9D6_JUGRE|nr:L-type lectin-domain containing receptor kinase IV.1-like [Juglans regia]KAF5471639.1 hypothetical protein F2P56_008416 [Juglans regia]